MLGIRVICVGRLKETFYTDASNEYIKRLRSYCKLEIVELSEFRLNSGTQYPLGIKNTPAQISIALEKERELIEKKIPAGAMTAAMCVEGREMDSNGLSEFLRDCAGRGASRLCFIIGGSFGLDETIKNAADFKLSMSKMTFPHNLARVMLLEQLYRAFNIAEGGKYHK